MRRVFLILGALASLVTLVGVSSVAGATAPALLPHGQGSLAASSSLAPVYLHFKPKSVTVAPGGLAHLGAVVKNKGTYGFVATSCILWFRLGTSGAWTRESSCLKSSDFPYTFSAHGKVKFSSSQRVSKTAPAGTYEWKLVLVGTYNGVTEDSHPGILSVTVT